MLTFAPPAAVSSRPEGTVAWRAEVKVGRRYDGVATAGDSGTHSDACTSLTTCTDKVPPTILNNPCRSCDHGCAGAIKDW